MKLNANASLLKLNTLALDAYCLWLAEVEQVLAWATRRFPDGPGDLDEGASWCHDLHVSPEGDWVTVSLSISGTPSFGEAFARAFAGAIGQGED